MEHVLNILVSDLSLRSLGSPVVLFVRHLKDHFVPHERNGYRPHVLGHRALALFSLMLVSLKVATIVIISVGPILPAYSSAITTGNIISLTNASRKEFGLGSVVENSVLNKAAQAKANDMLAKGYFSHNNPDGKTPWDFIVAAGYNYLSAGENLAINFTEAENVETAWMNSPGHKANILNKNFEEIGVGIAEGQYQDHMAIFVVQMFGIPSGQKVTLTDKPTAVQTETVPPPVTAAVLPLVTKPENTKVAGAQGQKAEVVASSPVPPDATAQEITLDNTQANLEDGRLSISAHASGNVVKLVAAYGEQAIMLEPKEGGLWKGNADVTAVFVGNTRVSLQAFDILGNAKTVQLAEFAGSTPQNFNVLPEAKAATVSLAGFTFQPKAVEQRVYLLFIAGILTSLIFAIAIRKHIQHVVMVANGAFVVILACVLFIGG